MENTIVLNSNMTHSSFPFGGFTLGKKIKNIPQVNSFKNTFDLDLVFTTIADLNINIPEFKEHKIIDLNSESYLTMLASEKVLKKDWDNPSEDDAWKNL